MEKNIDLKSKLSNLNENKITKIFIFLCVLCAACLAYIQPDDFGPDEKMKMDICKFIAEYGELPHGGDERVRNPEWGISYGFTPILSYMVGGGFIKICSIFSQDLHHYYFAARLVSVLCYGVFLIFVAKIGEKIFKNKLFKWFFIIQISILPQVMFIGSYINNDSLALMCISIIIYSWIYGIEKNWNYKSCLLLAVGLGLCALSYYNAYGYILISVLVYLISQFKNKTKFIDIMKKGIFISIIAFIICGWWFIRSAILYDGDFLGMKTTDEYAEKYAVDAFKPSIRETPMNQGQSLFYMFFDRSWLITTLKSFVAVFGKMNMSMKSFTYLFIYAVWLITVIAYFIKKIHFVKHKKNKERDIPRLLEISFWCNIFITVFLSVFYSYTNDFQPQGRYLMPIIIPLMYIITSGLEFLLETFVNKDKTKYIITFILLGSYTLYFANCMLLLLYFYLPNYLN